MLVVAPISAVILLCSISYSNEIMGASASSDNFDALVAAISALF
jgi:hypothetical protein